MKLPSLTSHVQAIWTTFPGIVEGSLHKLDRTSIAPEGGISGKFQSSSTSGLTAKNDPMRLSRGRTSSSCSPSTICTSAFASWNETRCCAGTTHKTWWDYKPRPEATLQLASRLSISTPAVCEQGQNWIKHVVERTMISVSWCPKHLGQASKRHVQRCIVKVRPVIMMTEAIVMNNSLQKHW